MVRAERMPRRSSVWFLIGHGGMDNGDYWGLYWDYYRDPFPLSILSTRQSFASVAVFPVNSSESESRFPNS